MIRYKMPRLDSVDEMLWVGDTLVMLGRRNPRRRRGDAEHLAIRSEDQLLFAFGFTVGGMRELHADYGAVLLGTIDGQAAAEYPLSRYDEIPSVYRLLEEQNLHRPIDHNKKVAGSKKFVPVYHHERMSRAGNVLAITGCQARYRDNIIHFLPSHVEATAMKSMNRYTFMLYNHATQAVNIYEIDEPVTGVAVKADELIVAVRTRLYMYLWDIG